MLVFIAVSIKHNLRYSSVENPSFSWSKSAKKIIPNWSLKQDVKETITLTSPSPASFLFWVKAAAPPKPIHSAPGQTPPKSFSPAHKLTRHWIKDGEAALQAPSFYINSYFTYSCWKIQQYTMPSVKLSVTPLRSKGEIRSPSTGPSYILLGVKTIWYLSFLRQVSPLEK